jgi:hypothetical protein
MRSFLRKPIGKIIAAVSVTAMVAVVGFAIYLASLTGSLPWQTDPTRIAITPFADIPGFNLPVVTATPVTRAGTPAAYSAEWRAHRG